MLEEEILELLSQAREINKTLDATAKVLGVPISTYCSWMKGKGVKNQPLFKALDNLGIHIGKSEVLEQQEKSLASVELQTLVKTTDIKTKILEAEIDGLKAQIKMLTSHNESLQEQLKTVNSMLSGVLSKKEMYCTPVPEKLNRAVG